MTKKFLGIILIFLIGTLLIFAIVRNNVTNRRQARVNAKAQQLKVTIIEGWTVQDIAAYLEKQNITTANEFLKAEMNFNISSYPLLASKPQKNDLEGFLFPDTYLILKPASQFATATSPSIIKKMLENFTVKFTPEMVNQAGKNGMSVYQTIIFASIVERETGRNVTTGQQKQALDAERKIIAGIFHNRLSADIALQSDATVNYLTKKPNPSVSLEDTQIDSPYNTYKYRGLPPGPIGNPSLSSIMAVLYPQKTDFYYFLHKQPGGEPVYSKTLEEHNINKQKYLK